MTTMQKPTFEQLLQENNLLRQQVPRLNQQLQYSQEKIIYLEEQLALLQKHVFSKRSERITDLPDEQIDFLADLKQEAPTPRPVQAHTRKPRGQGTDGLTFPDDLPVETKFLDVSEADKFCPETGAPLKRIGEDVTRKLAYKPGSYHIKEYVRPKYALPNGEGVRSRGLPDTILPRCLADESLLAEIVTKKFVDHLPLYRIVEIMKREKITISRQLLSQWIVALGKAVDPLCKELDQQITLREVLHIDESPLKLQMKGKGKTHKAYMWVRVAGAGALYIRYHFHLTRKHGHAEALLSGYRGYVHSDKYQAYANLAKQKQFTWAPCWAHIRRKFVEAENGDPPFRKWILRHIKYLFMLERIAWKRTPEERLRIRKEIEGPIIDKIVDHVKKKFEEGGVLPKSALSKALGYLYSMNPYLKNYTLHPEACIDNNAAERAIRPLALGRKNWLFVGSQAGGKASANLMSLTQTCKANGINPREYLEDVFRRIMSHSNQKLIDLLPDNWAAAREQESSVKM